MREIIYSVFNGGLVTVDDNATLDEIREAIEQDMIECNIEGEVEYIHDNTNSKTLLGNIE